MYTGHKPLAHAVPHLTVKCSPKQFRQLQFTGQYSTEIRNDSPARYCCNRRSNPSTIQHDSSCLPRTGVFFRDGTRFTRLLEIWPPPPVRTVANFLVGRQNQLWYTHSTTGSFHLHSRLHIKSPSPYPALVTPMPKSPSGSCPRDLYGLDRGKFAERVHARIDFANIAWNVCKIRTPSRASELR